MQKECNQCPKVFGGRIKKKKAIKNLIYNCVNMQHLGINMGIPSPFVN